MKKSDHSCAFCSSKLDKLSIAINKCSKCDAEYYLVISEGIDTKIISFDTQKYCIQIYSHVGGSSVTRVNYRDNKEALFWVKEEINLENTSLERIEKRIDKLMVMS